LWERETIKPPKHVLSFIARGSPAAGVMVVDEVLVWMTKFLWLTGVA